MNKVILKDHAAFALDSRKGPEKEIDSILPYLGSIVEVMSDSFVFMDLWKLIYKDKDVIEVIFREATGGFPLEPFDKKYNSTKGEYAEGAYFSVQKSADLNLDLETGQYDLNLYGYVNIIDPNITWSLLGDYGYSHLPLKIGTDYQLFRLAAVVGDKEVDVLDYPLEWEDAGNNLKRLKKADYDIQHRGSSAIINSSFTLWELIYAILFEITFNGSSEDGEKFVKMLNERYEDVIEGKDIDSRESADDI